MCERENTMMSMPESWRWPIRVQVVSPPSAACTAACHAFALLLPRSCHTNHRSRIASSKLHAPVSRCSNLMDVSDGGQA